MIASEASNVVGSMRTRFSVHYLVVNGKTGRCINMRMSVLTSVLARLSNDLPSVSASITEIPQKTSKLAHDSQANAMPKEDNTLPPLLIYYHM